MPQTTVNAGSNTIVDIYRAAKLYSEKNCAHTNDTRNTDQMPFPTHPSVNTYTNSTEIKRVLARTEIQNSAGQQVVEKD